MLISELIEELNKIKNVYGDLEVHIDSVDKETPEPVMEVDLSISCQNIEIRDYIA